MVVNGQLCAYTGTGENVQIPEGVTCIGEAVFWDRKDIASVSIPRGVTTIRRWAFGDCEALEGVTVPESLQTMEDYAFRGCPRLADSDGFVIVKGKLFEYMGPGGDVEIPQGVTEIAEHALSGHEDITGVTIPEGAFSLGDNACADCRNLSRITIAEGVKFIVSRAFLQCRSLESVVLPESVISIGDGAFYGCEALERIRIPQAVEEILDEELDVPYVVCFTAYAASHAKYPVYLGGSPYELPVEVQPGALEGFRYAMRYGIYEVTRWESDYHRISQEGVKREAPTRRRVVSGFDEMLADVMADSLLDVEGLALETDLTEEEILDYLNGRRPSPRDAMDIAEGLDWLGYGPDLFFEADD